MQLGAGFFQTGRAFGVALIFVVGAAGSSMASPIDVGGKGELTCTIANGTVAGCQGFFEDNSGNISLSSSEATLFDVTPVNEGNQADFLNNNLTGTTSFTASDATRTNQNGADTASYQVDAPWFNIKLGAGTAFFQNTANSLLDVEWEKVSGPAGSAGGLSNETQFGSLSNGGGVHVPVPASILLLGVTLAFFAIAHLLRNRKI